MSLSHFKLFVLFRSLLTSVSMFLSRLLRHWILVWVCYSSMRGVSGWKWRNRDLLTTRPHSSSQFDFRLVAQQANSTYSLPEYPVINDGRGDQTATKRAMLLGVLYLAQSAPKGYLLLIPSILREQRTSLKTIAAMSLVTLPDLLKPVIGLLLDSSLFTLQSVESRKQLILLCQLLLLLGFGYEAWQSSTTPPSIQRLVLLFTLTSVLTAVHDTTVDGVAVQTQSAHNRRTSSTHSISSTSFGQYLGYKLGGLLACGVLPWLCGQSHRMFCFGISLTLALSFLYVLVTPFTPASQSSVSTDTHAVKETAAGSFQRLYQLLFDRNLRHTLTLLVILFFYKFGEHAMDYLWTIMLVDAGISRKAIIESQLLIGTLAAIVGAYLGTRLTSACYSHLLQSNKRQTHPSSSNTAQEGQLQRVAIWQSVAWASILRLGSECFQILFAYQLSTQPQTAGWYNHPAAIAMHSIYENIAGSALTSTVFSLLLVESAQITAQHQTWSATSYAVMNAIVLLGMQLGKYVSRYAQSVEYTQFCVAMAALNVLFSAGVGSVTRRMRREQAAVQAEREKIER